MAKVAYWDCLAGMAGDMCLGALVHGGVPLEYLQSVIDGLGLPEQISLSSAMVKKQGQAATKVEVKFTTHHHHDHSHAHEHRHLAEIEQIIQSADLAQPIKELSLKTFRHLAIAEGQVHGVAPEKVHFHEVGALDAIADIVGTCAGLHWLGVEEVYCSAMPTGGGTVSCAHGVMPVPTPAVLALWAMGQVPVYSNGIEQELVTPTGAALAVSLAKSFGHAPPMAIKAIGIGAGTRDLPIPNILRLWIGETSSANPKEQIAVLETHVDDTTPQAIAYVMELLLSAGAWDVFTQPITMKKSRLGTLITVICPPELVPTCERILFQETSTLGIRQRYQERTVLMRQSTTVETAYGVARVKIAKLGENNFKIQPEYQDCAALAQAHQVPFHLVWSAVYQAGKHLQP
jgi:uncharacterized protein (TIGR00299 family) protein